MQQMSFILSASRRDLKQEILVEVEGILGKKWTSKEWAPQPLGLPERGQKTDDLSEVRLIPRQCSHI